MENAGEVPAISGTVGRYEVRVRRLPADEEVVNPGGVELTISLGEGDAPILTLYNEDIDGLIRLLRLGLDQTT